MVEPTSKNHKGFKNKGMIKALKKRIKKTLLNLFGSINNDSDMVLLQDKNYGVARVSYSQQGEDLALQRIFEGVARGFYVDIGAFHPKQYSNTLNFYNKGWKGLNVEPNKNNFLHFSSMRPNDINVNCGIGTSKDSMTYYEFSSPELNTFNQAHKEHWQRQQGFNLVGESQVVIQTLKDLLDQNLPAGTNIDFLTIDVEGQDLDVLKSNEWEIYRPRIIVVEESFYELSSLESSEIYKFLRTKHYRLISITGGSTFYLNEDYNK